MAKATSTTKNLNRQVRIYCDKDGHLSFHPTKHNAKGRYVDGGDATMGSLTQTDQELGRILRDAFSRCK